MVFGDRIRLARCEVCMMFEKELTFCFADIKRKDLSQPCQELKQNLLVSFGEQAISKQISQGVLLHVWGIFLHFLHVSYRNLLFRKTG